MRLKLAALAGLMMMAAPSAGFAQEYKMASVFSGNELRLYVLNYVNNDCTSGVRPDVHVVTQPANGTVRLEPVPVTVDRAASDPLSKCNGKKVDGMAVLYTSKFAYVGLDKLVLETDFRTGTIRRYEALIDVR
jgi:hypothetical protein